MTEGAVLCGVQVAVATALGAVAWTVAGVVALWVPAIGLFAGAWWFAERLGRRAGGLQRAQVKRWALMSAVVHGSVAAGVYVLWSPAS